MSNRKTRMDRDVEDYLQSGPADEDLEGTLYPAPYAIPTPATGPRARRALARPEASPGSSKRATPGHGSRTRARKTKAKTRKKTKTSTRTKVRATAASKKSKPRAKSRARKTPVGKISTRKRPARRAGETRRARVGRPVDALALVRDAIRRTPPPTYDSRGNLRASAERLASSDGVFVSALHRRVGKKLGMTLPEFKNWLIAQMRESNLMMTRADLVDIMPRRTVNDSEIEHLGATFHFVHDPTAPPT